MTLLRVVVGDTGPVLRGERIFLRHPAMHDFQSWADVRAESRSFLKPWEPTWGPDDLTRAAYRRRVRRYNRDVREETGAPFFVFRREDERLIGGLTLSNIRRGVTLSCSLGYWMGERYAGQGFMSDAVRTVIPYVFDDLRLHRLEAASMPANTRSIGLLEKVGFTREGFARRYLLIDGVWQDHVLYAMLAEDPRPGGARSAMRRFGIL